MSTLFSHSETPPRFRFAYSACTVRKPCQPEGKLQYFRTSWLEILDRFRDLGSSTPFNPLPPLVHAKLSYVLNEPSIFRTFPCAPSTAGTCSNTVARSQLDRRDTSQSGYTWHTWLLSHPTSLYCTEILRPFSYHS